MSERAITWAQEQRCPNATAKFALMRLAAYADAQGVAWAYVERLADEMQTTDRTVQRALRALEGAGLIRRTGKFHHRNIPFYRLDLERAAAERTVTPVSPLNGDASVTVGKSNGDTCVGANGDTSVTPKQGNQPSEGSNEPPSGRGRAGASGARFAEVWRAYPEAGRKGVSSQREGMAAWAAECELVGEERLAQAVLGYARDRSAWGASGRPLAFHRCLSAGRYEDFLPVGSAGVAARPAAFAGPGRLREQVVQAAGEAFAVSYLDGCGWSGERQVLTARTNAAFERLRDRVGGLITEMDITLARPTAAGLAE